MVTPCNLYLVISEEQVSSPEMFLQSEVVLSIQLPVLDLWLSQALVSSPGAGRQPCPLIGSSLAELHIAILAGSPRDDLEDANADVDEEEEE